MGPGRTLADGGCTERADRALQLTGSLVHTTRTMPAHMHDVTRYHHTPRPRATLGVGNGGDLNELSCARYRAELYKLLVLWVVLDPV